MIYLITIVLSSLFWRIRGGLDIWFGKNLPANKIWYALLFGLYGCIYYSYSMENFLIGFLCCYVSYQLYGWGLYLGRLLIPAPVNPETDRECELIDDILYSIHISHNNNKYYLYSSPRIFGFLGITLTGLILSFLWGLYLANLMVMLSGLLMGLCYYLGSLLNKLKSDNKMGWNWGEWIFGAYLGFVLGYIL